MCEHMFALAPPSTVTRPPKKGRNIYAELVFRRYYFGKGAMRSGGGSTRPALRGVIVVRRGDGKWVSTRQITNNPIRTGQQQVSGEIALNNPSGALVLRI